MRPSVFLFLSLCGVLLAGGLHLSAGADYRCSPTAPDSLGPFYEPDAPRRSSVGKGYVMTGAVKSAADCSPVARAAIEFWLANPEGVYDDGHRATVLSDGSGAYRFESNPPPHYGFRPPHIHMRIAAEGFRPLVTQHYPEEGASEAKFDVVLIPR